MRWGELKDGVAGMNAMGARMALKDYGLARSYVSQCVRIYNDLMGVGLEAKDAIEHAVAEGWGSLSSAARVELPAQPNGLGGTRPDELFYLAAVTRVLRPKKIFEIGTFQGRTTSAFVLNAPADAFADAARGAA